jgi:hypothetical protein
MSEGIPDDVMERARVLRQRVVWSSNGSIEDVARALLAEREAERERAALIAEMHDHQGVIAAAIRSPTASPIPEERGTEDPNPKRDT